METLCPHNLKEGAKGVIVGLLRANHLSRKTLPHLSRKTLPFSGEFLIFSLLKMIQRLFSGLFGRIHSIQVTFLDGLI